MPHHEDSLFLQGCFCSLSRKSAPYNKEGGAGSILNSKSDYDCCRIPRLIVEQEDEEGIKKPMKEELTLDKKIIE